MKQNAPAPIVGSLGRRQNMVSPAHIARGGGQGSPGKTINYAVDGSGRDSYIHCNMGGFASNYKFQNERDAYVKSLRGYPTSAVNTARNSNGGSKDHLVEG